MKPRVSILDPFKADLEKWLSEEKCTYDQVMVRLKERGCNCARSNVAKWWGNRMEELGREALLAQIASGARTCAQVDAKLKKDGAPELESLAGMLKALTMQLAVHGQAEPETLKLVLPFTDRVVSLVTALESQKRTEIARNQVEVAERRVKLLEERAAKADEVEKTVKSDLTPEQQMARIKETFGLA